MSTNPRFTKHWQRKINLNKNTPAATKHIPGKCPLLSDNCNTEYSPIGQVTMPPCTSETALSRGTKESEKDKYEVSCDEDFDAWLTKWEAQEAQRVINGAPIRYNEHGQEIDDDLEEYLSKVQREISRSIFEKTTEGVLAHKDCEEAGLVERKPGYLPPPLLKPNLTDEVPEDIKYMRQAEQQGFGTPMQGIAITAAVYQDLNSEIDKEEKIRIEMKKTTTRVMSGKDTSVRASWTGDDNTATKSPSNNQSTFSINQCISRPPGWPESIPLPPTSRNRNSCQPGQPDQSPIANSNGGEEPNTLCESESPRAIGYYQGTEAYIRTDTAYTKGPAANPTRDLNKAIRDAGYHSIPMCKLDQMTIRAIGAVQGIAKEGEGEKIVVVVTSGAVARNEKGFSAPIFDSGNLIFVGMLN
ncbi:unnamed protein product [Tuber aestivum]|uniref:Uncharacterized protein n=1 Tax=Tuber aestivum TaxID=59557 RepID=A0A292Q3I8_9PEZI|nr:unnamed protein product [Tuber aestivum]